MPKIVDRERKRREIAIAALEIFTDNGFETASMSQVAAAAGIGKGTIYEYFSSKEELVVFSIMTTVEEMMFQVEKLLDEIDDPVEKLKSYVYSTMEVFVNDKRMVKFMVNMFQVMLLDDEMFSKSRRLSEILVKMRRIVVSIFLDGISKGVFRPEIAKDAENIAINLVAYLDGIAVHFSSLFP